VIAPTRLDARRFTAFGGAACSIHSCEVALDDVSACIAEVYAFESRLTRFRPDSELSSFNAQAGHRVAVSPLLAELLHTALDAYALSDGLVNAAVLPALVAAGYDRSIEQVRRRRPSAVATTANAAVAVAAPRQPAPPLPAVLHVGAGWASLDPGCAVDLGGVGKGWLADRLCERLDNAVVNLGGDLAACGEGLDGGGWTVGLCDGWAVTLTRGGVATSGTEGRRWATGHHLIDPRTGAPADTDIREVSVVAASAATAEALSKAAVMLGSQQAAAWLAARGAAHSAVRTADPELRPELA
jgi:thiamine biosynthesis lipoprotein